MLIDCPFRGTDVSAPGVKVSIGRVQDAVESLAATATLHGLSHFISLRLLAVKAFLVILKQRQKRVAIWIYPYISQASNQV